MTSIRLHTALGALTVVSLLCGVAESRARAEDTRDRVVPETTAEDRSRPPPTGLQLGARVAFGLGSGDVYRGLGVADGSNGFIPVVVDVGARIVPELYVGAYGGWAHVLPKTNDVSCPSGFDCNITDWRFGLEVDWHFRPRLDFDPYVGVSGGYEILHNSVTGPTAVPTAAGPVQGTADASVTDRGFEFGGLTLGADMRIGRALALGPFFTASIGEFGSHSGSTAVSVQGNPVATIGTSDVEHRPHEIYMLGLRGTVNPL